MKIVVDIFKITLDIIYNFGVLVAISIISASLTKKETKMIYNGVVQGLVFGFAAIIGMLHPFVLAPGLIFDGRSVMISLASMYFGPLAAAISASLALFYRIYQGGSGTLMGILVIFSSAIVGTMFFYVIQKRQSVIKAKDLIFLGLLVHSIMILCMFAIPNRGIETIEKLGLPVIIIYPLATILIGLVLSEFTERRRVIESLVESEEAYKDLFEVSGDAIFILDDDLIQDCNNSAAQLLCVGNKDIILGENMWGFSPEKQPDDKLSTNSAKEITRECFEKNKLRFDWVFKNNQGILMPTEVVLTTHILRGKKIIQAIVRDMSERKYMEQKLEYMSFHDQLTGIYNRRYSEMALEEKNIEANLPLTIMIGDVNGLKLINDSFGHTIGDKLLVTVANIIKSVGGKNDVIARIGGDEFIMILPNTSEVEAEKLAGIISKLSSKERIESIDISVSLGWATKLDKNIEIKDVIKKAEDYVYKKKLFESPSMRGKTIQTIIHTLHEKNKREEAHSQRVSFICEKMGIALRLSESDIKELKNMGLLHDIGKIAIDEATLNKDGKLTEEEWTQISRHPEIGYRILSTVNDMAEMAEYILAHHERWDGRGYPKGLFEEEIPLQARIIAIADAFDAMISNRSYRKAMSLAFALEEIRSNAGIQFDPYLVQVFLSIKEIQMDNELI